MLSATLGLHGHLQALTCTLGFAGKKTWIFTDNTVGGRVKVDGDVYVSFSVCMFARVHMFLTLHVHSLCMLLVYVCFIWLQQRF